MSNEVKDAKVKEKKSTNSAKKATTRNKNNTSKKKTTVNSTKKTTTKTVKETKQEETKVKKTSGAKTAKKVTPKQSTKVVAEKKTKTTKVEETPKEVEVVEEKIVEEKKEEKNNKLIKALDIFLWVVLIAWMLVVVIDYVKVVNEKEPVFCIKEEVLEYSDGSVDSCTGLGYKVYKYNRESYQAIEFGPFWTKVRNDK